MSPVSMESCFFPLTFCGVTLVVHARLCDRLKGTGLSQNQCQPVVWRKYAFLSCFVTVYNLLWALAHFRKIETDKSLGGQGHWGWGTIVPLLPPPHPFSSSQAPRPHRSFHHRHLLFNSPPPKFNFRSAVPRESLRSYN